MPNIRILPEQLANRIAAGEVVERPASIVKELVENSLDAGASRIEVEVEGGGTRLIRVLDNGSGMDEDDVLLCFERHGTSKIDETHDLIAIRTLGFRGEAIPSIASVAKMTITSRTEDSELGTEAHFEYGRLQKVHETGCHKGTVIEVRSLFGRTPARKKFLRTHRTEIGHIDEILKNYALASPETAFTLRINGKKTLSFNSSHDLESRLRTIMGYDDTLIPIGEDKADSSKRRIHGFLVPPERSSGSSARLRLFINGRAIKDRLMRHAVFEGLRGFLLKGNSPGGYLHLFLPAGELDVNVHPAKHEVRFRSSGDIHQFIRQAVETAMFDYQQSIRSSLFTNSRTARENISRRSVAERVSMFPPPYVIKSDEHLDTTSPPSQNTSISWSKSSVHEAASRQPLQTSEPELLSNADQDYENSASTDYLSNHHGIQVIGQYKNLYIFCQAGDSLLVIDQHAAHERILYEKFRRQYSNNQVASQSLLFPETVELSPFQIQLVENNSDELQRLGFTLQEFGGNSYVISAIPALAGQIRASEIFYDILDGFGREDSQRSGGKLDNILATMACKAAVRSGDELSLEEIDALLEAMAKADLFSHCPHGRPVLKSFSDKELKKWFYRT
jgi:DNA mismatch repair protein MutL